MKKKADSPPSLPASPAPPGQAAILLALGMTATFVAVLSLRPVMSVDVGYHLAYGEQFLRTGQIVDSSEFIYTCDPSLAPARRPEPGPGCWYDQNGEYRFPNANWLSQVIMALTHRLGGMRALSILTAAMVVATMAAAFTAMRRCGVGTLASAGGVVLAALAGYERFNMRPELPGYLVLLIQVAILVPAAGAGRTISRRALVAIVALQILLVNLHSYFLLALAMTGAVLADRLARSLWRRLVVRNGQEADPLAGQTGRLAILLAAQTAACLVNPWTWRLAILPVQTLLYLRRHHVSAAAGGEHPWANIVEFYPTFTAGAFSAPIVMGVYVTILALAGAGILAAVWRRRWAWAGILAGAAAVSCSMRRNISVTSAVMACVALASLWHLIAPRLGRKSRPEWLGMAMAAGLAVVSMALAVSVVSQRFYAWEGSSYRFGVGIDRVWTPLAAAEWINANQPAGRLWTDANVSSNMCYFTRPHRWVPSLTNTWAYPPATFKESLELVAG
ncbi:MAG: hypothetical protein NT031_09705, partial [Planctomycetota bacterium]|nr:hypothetical protein [Planctomycetota bacterium]